MRPFAIRFSRRHAAQVAMLALAVTLAGCSLFRQDESREAREARAKAPAGAKPASTNPVSEQDVQTFTGAVPGVLQPMNRPILQGPLPLIYLTEGPASLRITNVGTGEEITVVEVKEMQILRVEAKGVVLANETVLGARLAPGTYAITPLSENAGVVRAQQIHIRPTVPTSKPAAALPPAPTADTPPPAN